MNKKAITQIQTIIIVAIIAIAAIAGGWYYTTLEEPTPPPESYRIALIVEKSALDGSYNEFMYNAVQDLLQKREDIGLSIAENVAITDFPRVASEYCDEGYDLILAHTNGYMEAVLSVAPDHPDTDFIVTGGLGFGPPNVAGVGVWGNEAYYLLGIIAGMMTETNIVGCAGTFAFASQLEKMNGFISGVWSVNSDIEVLTSFIGSWFDIAKSYETIITMIDSGADWICPVGSGAAHGAIQACTERDIPMFGAMLDMNHLAPDVVVSSAYYMPTSAPLIELVDLAQAGELEPKNYPYFMHDGGTGIAPYHGWEDRLPQEVKDAVEAKKQEIIQREFEVPFIPNVLITD